MFRPNATARSMRQLRPRNAERVKMLAGMIPELVHARHACSSQDAP